MLAKLSLCRTKTLRGHTYKCPRCHHETQVYNSCTDRNCPLCSGAKRADWLDKTAQLLLPGVNYFQVIFTLPDLLHGLMLGNRSEMFNVLFRAAWASLRDLLRKEQGIEPAATMVFHTWNQELDFHPHIHCPFPLPGIEFTRRWALHILPKGFTKVHRYGGYSGRLCRDYLDRCRALLAITDQASQDAASDEILPPSSSLAPNCPHCKTPLERTGSTRRPSWKKLFTDNATCPIWHGYWHMAKPRVSHRPREPDG